MIVLTRYALENQEKVLTVQNVACGKIMGPRNHIMKGRSNKMTHIERLKKDHPEWDESRIAIAISHDCPTPMGGKPCPCAECQECWESEEKNNG